MTSLTEGDRQEAAAVLARIAEGHAAEKAALDVRDDLIRKHRTAGVPSKDVEEAFGLSRSSVDAIRQGHRGR